MDFSRGLWPKCPEVNSIVALVWGRILGLGIAGTKPANVVAVLVAMVELNLCGQGSPTSISALWIDARKAGVTVPIVPAIMPITGFANIVRFCSGCGADLPRWIRLRLEELESDKSGLQEFGAEVVTRLR